MIESPINPECCGCQRWCVRSEDGNDIVNASPSVATAATLPLWIYGGDGNDGKPGSDFEI